MSIIISKKGTNTQKVDKSDFIKENYLQEYIHNNPESIPVYEIQENKKLMVVKREFSTQSGPVDALAVDQDGDIYIVETKLYKNPDKRTVVAQALDYGASLWMYNNNFREFYGIIEDEIQSRFKLSFEQRAKEFYDLEDEQFQSLKDNMEKNLRDGIIRFVILMDSMDERLKNLIVYINQNSQFDIYGVQLEYYKYEDLEITIPKIFGVVTKKPESTSTRKTWSTENFLEDAKNRIADDKSFKILSEIYNFTASKADKIEFGTGAGKGSFTYKFKDTRAKSGFVSILTIYSDGTIQFRFPNIKARIGEGNCILFYSKLKNVIPNITWEEKEVVSGKGWGLSLELGKAFPQEKDLDSFKSMVLEYIKEVKR
jgi:hypothetical protein